MDNISAICFDLDDTLWDLKPIIPRAENELYAWFSEHYPKVIKVWPADRIPALRFRMAEKFPELNHDLTELRMRTLRKVLTDSGYEESAAAEAFDVFQRVRNDVTLYDDVIPTLEVLQGKHRLIAMTNGNASLDAIGIKHYFENVYTARELGVAKPELRFFAKVLAAEGLAPEAALHVGDHPEHDIVSASKAGMRTVWINRKGARWNLPDCKPDHEIDSLRELPKLLYS